ncbi:hypothetical protein [Rubellicoccus peritrichatus]|uniref:Uncharacterized protein n=1 Tax=Rubellicoccus peritrichatus TaxID=3080537 RepID=A0AAQ3QSZ3_9BACT|nr:hypothetical protein [Puniceicoccus sp. CR14]WOO40741.1 hypothetical protein RZN69_19130 [Puniceicoccus sp. CR14]
MDIKTLMSKFTSRTTRRIILIGLAYLMSPVADAGELTIDLSNNQIEEIRRLRIRGGLVEYPKENELIDLFQDYHLEVIKGIAEPVSNELRQYAKQQNPDKSFLISSNMAGGMNNGRWIEAISSFDYLNNEIDVSGLKKGLGEYLLIKQLTEAVGVGLMVMPNAKSNSIWSNREDPELYGKATALAYATGSHMHIPWCLYDGSQRGRFYGRPQTHAKYFQLIADNQDYFDDHTGLAWNEFTVPYTSDGLRNQQVIEDQLERFFEDGIPTYIRFDDKAFVADRGYRATLPATERDVQPRYETTLKEADKVSSPTKGNVAYHRKFFPPIIRVSDAPSLTPAVFHVIERFNGKEVRRPSFVISPDLIDPRQIESVSYITVGQTEKPASIRRSKSGTRVEVPSKVNDWAVFRVKTTEPIALPHLPQEPYRSVVAESEIPVMRLIRFSDTWKRPDWVNEMIDNMPPDPIKEYDTTRITWSYDKRPSSIKYAHDNGWTFHGTENIAAVHIGEQKNAKRPGLRWKQEDNWQGFARNADGEILLMRSDFDPPIFSASFATEEHQDWFLERNKEWVDRGVDGVQWDDLAAPLNRIWRHGGDFSEGSLEGFRTYLAKRGIADDKTISSSIDVLRQQLVETARPIYVLHKSDNKGPGFLRIPYNQNSDSRGNLWLITPPIELDGETLEARITFRTGKEAHGDASFYLLDKTGSVYYSTLKLNKGKLSNKAKDSVQTISAFDIPNEEWTTLTLKFDLKNSTYTVKLDQEGQRSEPLSFRKPVPNHFKTAAFGILLNAKDGSFDLQSITLKN